MSNVKYTLSKNAFTLLELIIVIIIMGVLVSVALPKFTQVVDVSKRVEAYAVMGTIRKGFEEYKLSNDNYEIGVACLINPSAWLPSFWQSGLNMDDPNQLVGGNFTYKGVCSDQYFQISAHLNKNPDEDYILMTGFLGDVFYSGFGIYSKIGEDYTAAIQALIDDYNSKL